MDYAILSRAIAGVGRTVNNNLQGVWFSEEELDRKCTMNVDD